MLRTGPLVHGMQEVRGLGSHRLHTTPRSKACEAEGNAGPAGGYANVAVRELLGYVHGDWSSTRTGGKRRLEWYRDLSRPRVRNLRIPTLIRVHHRDQLAPFPPCLGLLARPVLTVRSFHRGRLVPRRYGNGALGSAAVARHLSQDFAVDEAQVWRAVRVALSRVTNQASFWEQERRIEWSEDWSASSWGQVFDVSVSAAGPGSSILSMSHRSTVRLSLADRGRAKAVFERLVEGVRSALAEPATLPVELPSDDRVRYWNGEGWTDDPPPVPG